MPRRYSLDDMVADCRREFETWPQWLKDYYEAKSTVIKKPKKKRKESKL